MEFEMAINRPKPTEKVLEVACADIMERKYDVINKCSSKGEERRKTVKKREQKGNNGLKSIINGIPIVTYSILLYLLFTFVECNNKEGSTFAKAYRRIGEAKPSQKPNAEWI